MPMKRDDFIKSKKEFDAAVAVLDTGMPQATEHERRAMRARARVLREVVTQAPWQVDNNGHVKER